jgi:cytochrome c-type biogenesis protein CcmH/NrfG
MKHHMGDIAAMVSDADSQLKEARQEARTTSKFAGNFAGILEAGEVSATRIDDQPSRNTSPHKTAQDTIIEDMVVAFSGGILLLVFVVMYALQVSNSQKIISPRAARRRLAHRQAAPTKTYDQEAARLMTTIAASSRVTSSVLDSSAL